MFLLTLLKMCKSIHVSITEVIVKGDVVLDHTTLKFYTHKGDRVLEILINTMQSSIATPLKVTSDKTLIKLCCLFAADLLYC